MFYNFYRRGPSHLWLNLFQVLKISLQVLQIGLILQVLSQSWTYLCIQRLLIFFCVLILYLVALPNYLTSSHKFLVKSFGSPL